MHARESSDVSYVSPVLDEGHFVTANGVDDDVKGWVGF